MDTYNSRLLEIIVDRVHTLDVDQLRSALIRIAVARPASVVGALNYAATLELDVEETLLEVPPET